MSVKVPNTVDQLLQQVESNSVLIPSIQRPFVWKRKQIVQLWDSMMRGYPIGSLLMWPTNPADHKHVRFYQVCRDYTGPDSVPVTATSTRTVNGLLDGQQRVTAMTIGVLGSLSSTKRTERLYLCLDADPSAGPEAEQYRFEFLSEPPVPEDAMFLVAKARGLGRTASERNAAMKAQQIAPSRERRETLGRLIEVIHDDQIRADVVNGDPRKVLNIFARINTGGTHLSFVDLLVSTFSTNSKQWDAQADLKTLRQELAALDMRLSNERILKAALLMVGLSPKFDIEALNKAKAWQKVEAEWAAIHQALVVAATTFKQFGLSTTVLSAENAVVPIALYAYQRKLGISYAYSDKDESDRRRVRAFVARTIMQRAYWTGAVDDVLVTCSKVLRKNHGRTFPLALLEEALANTKPISADGLTEVLLELAYSDRRTAPLLRLLFPHMVGKGLMQKDHIFPRGGFRSGHSLAEKVELLPNLQLLLDADNQSKSKKLPKVWYDGLCSETTKKRYRDQGVKHLPATVGGAPHFWATREAFLRQRIDRLLTGK